MTEDGRSNLPAGPGSLTGRQIRRWLFFLMITVTAFHLLQVVPESSSFLPSSLRYTSSTTTRNSLLPQSPLDRSLAKSWAELAKAIQKARPTVTSVDLLRTLPAVSIEKVDDTTTIDNVLNLNQHDLKALQKTHARFIREIEQRQIKPVFQRKRAGIAITADRNSLPTVLLQLRLLNRLESSLPVEVFFLSEQEYDKSICDLLFESFGASCRLLDAFLLKETLPWLPEQRGTRTIHANEPLHKYLAVYFSSYEDVLCLDPDTLLYNNPDAMFTDKPYTSSNLVLWPDFWLSSVSPKMYEVQQQVRNPKRDYSRTVDMGHFIISKAKHADVLALSIYYTYYGDRLFDNLLMQGAIGERGSMAIVLAAQFFNKDYYVVRKNVQAVGFPDHDDKNNFRGTAMLQYNAQDDLHKRADPRPAFIRTTNPSLNPLQVMQSNSLYFKSKTAAAAIANSKGEAHRLWEWSGARGKANGWKDSDPERAVWEELSRVACDDLAKSPGWSTASSQCTLINQYRSDIGFVKSAA